MFIYTKREKISDADVVTFNLEIKDAQVEGTPDIKAYRIGTTVTAIFGGQTKTGTITKGAWDDDNGNGVIMFERPIKVSTDEFEALNVLFREKNYIADGENGHIVIYKDGDSVNVKIGSTLIEGAIEPSSAE